MATDLRAAESEEISRLLDPPAELQAGQSPAGEQAWVESLVRWLLDRGGLPLPFSRDRDGRLRLLNAALSIHPRREEVLERMSAVWNHTSAVRLLSEMGLPDHTSFLKESLQRLTDRLVPMLDPREDLYALVDRLRLTGDDAEWLAKLGPEERARWGGIFRPPLRSFATAAELLALRAASIGLSRDLLLHQPGLSELESPFFKLVPATTAVARAPGDAAAYAAWEAVRFGCEQAVESVHERLERRGVSVDLVFRLDLVRDCLSRMESLLHLAAGGGDGFALAATLVRGSYTQHSLRDLLRGTLRRLALKVVEHTAQTGEHYIASTRAEWWAMLRSAAGGGALTAVTAFLKYGLSALPLAPGLMGLAHALNYSASFIAMQLLGLSLASKQPAMTGAALADALDQRRELGAEVDLIASIARTQLIAAVGNVALVMPVALLFDLLHRAATGRSLLDLHQAEHGLASLDPLHSMTLPFAAVTGVFLWLSSVAAGLAANWSAFRNLPAAVARSQRFLGVLGQARARRLAVLVSRHFSGIVAYLVLGLLLGLVPVVFQFAGVGLEVRHVTLSAGALALAASSLFFAGPGAGALQAGPVLLACAGIFGIGLLNFGVSFALALRLALQARGLLAVDRRRLLRGLWQALSRAPGRFVLPPGREAGK